MNPLSDAENRLNDLRLSLEARAEMCQRRGEHNMAWALLNMANHLENAQDRAWEDQAVHLDELAEGRQNP